MVLVRINRLNGTSVTQYICEFSDLITLLKKEAQNPNWKKSGKFVVHPLKPQKGHHQMLIEEKTVVSIYALRLKNVVKAGDRSVETLRKYYMQAITKR